jgi:iron complex outermembrane receptor protein
MSASVRFLGNKVHERMASTLRLVPIVVVCLFYFLAAAFPAAAQTPDRAIQISLPAGDLADALDKLGDQSGVQIMYEPALAKGIKVAAVSGTLTVGDALKQLLAQTGLKADRVNDKTVVLKRLESNKTSAAPAVKKRPDDPSGAAGETGLEEIVVNAQKRGDERLLDVPVPITVLNAETLADNGQVLLQDYYASVPGLSVAPNELAAQLVTIRGLTTGGYTNPTVSVTVDNVPFGGSTNDIGGFEVPDIDPGDLAHIEVLRGPQGTLYGANSLGGIVNYVTKDPSTDQLSGRVSGSTSSVYNGAELGYSLRGSANVPISDTLAIRASAFTRQDPGYIDNPGLSLRGVNEATAYGSRLAALWKASDDLSIKVSALYQNTEGNGSPDVVTSSGRLQQNFIAGVGGSDVALQAYSATVRYKVGGASLTSITGYNDSRFHDSFDFTSFIGSFTQNGSPGTGFDGFGVTGTPYREDNHFTKFTQDLQLSVPIGESFEWLVGGFYTHEKTAQLQIISASNPDTGQVVGQWWNASLPQSYSEYAGYTDLTYHVTDRFDVQLGGRESEIKTGTGVTTELGPYDPVFLGHPSPVVIPAEETKASKFTYLATAKYKLSTDLMVYTRLASGYRPGGVNAPEPGTPNAYKPDTTQNYEIGLKGDFLDHTLTVDASVYDILWHDLQIQARNAAHFTYYTNGSGAKSQGVELAVTSRPLTHLTISGWLTYDDAALTKAFPADAPLYGAPGDRLPNSSRWSGNLSVNQNFPLPQQTTGFVEGVVSYVGDRVSVFNGYAADGITPLARQTFPSYTKTDLRAGVRRDSWTASLYANNVADVRGVLNGGAGYFYPFATIYIQPRTVGVNLVKEF